MILFLKTSFLRGGGGKPLPMNQKKFTLMNNLDFELLKQLLEVITVTINLINVISEKKNNNKKTKQMNKRRIK